MMSLGQDQPIYIYTHPYTRHFQEKLVMKEEMGTKIEKLNKR